MKKAEYCAILYIGILSEGLPYPFFRKHRGDETEKSEGKAMMYYIWRIKMRTKIYKIMVRTPVFTILTIVIFSLLTLGICLRFNLF